jgi:NAD(P)-dependent dehydrogenase (short-subunit alcohol dehydrogenase family)
MARTIASELSPRNIRVNVVAPGATKTPIWSRESTPSEEADELTAKMAAMIPLGRWGEADEIAKAILFLA